MNPGSSLRRIGWAMVLIVCTALYGALHLRVNAVKSEVRLAERQIVALQEEKVLLETEFQTRANQRQLATWNDVEFGYSAPRPGQFLEGERQLAQFGSPRVPGAPEPITVASAAPEETGTSFADLISTPAMAAEARPARENLSAHETARVAVGGLAGGAE
jgi:hypothetical protein